MDNIYLNFYAVLVHYFFTSVSMSRVAAIELTDSNIMVLAQEYFVQDVMMMISSLIYSMCDEINIPGHFDCF